MKPIPVAITCLVVLLGAPTGIALAQLPPDNAGVSEYTENVPSAGGNQPSDETQGGAGGASGGGGSGDADEGSELSAGVADEFGAAGADGEAAADLAEATAPFSGGANSGGQTDEGSPGGPATGSAAASTDPTGDADGSSPMGAGLLVALVVIFCAAIGFALVRRRVVSQPEGA